MLGLLTSTDPAWATNAKEHLPELLLDHAHCELKAAQSALSLVGRYAGEAPEIVEPLLSLVREETDHFEQVCAQTEERSLTLGPPEVDTYVTELRKAGSELGVPKLQSRLLVCAVIEARSCERFSVLAQALEEDDAGLAAFYRELMASEARHFQTFRSLATGRFGASADRSLERLMEAERRIVLGLDNAPRVHG